MITLDLEALLGNETASLLEHTCAGIPRERLHLPGPDFIERVMLDSDRQVPVLRNLRSLFDHGRLTGSGYVSRRYAHRIPFILKLNHNQLLSCPNTFDQTMFASIDQAFDLGAAGVGATIYYGSEHSDRQIGEVAEAFQRAHERGMFTILWCYLRNPQFKVEGVDYHTSADMTGQANHLGVTLQADIIKQKQPTLDGGYKAVAAAVGSYGKYDDRMYDELSSPHPIDLTRVQVANCYMGRAGLINSGGGSGQNDFAQAVRTAVINKRAGGTGLISGRKAFQRPMAEGVELLNAIQNVYLDERVTVA